MSGKRYPRRERRITARLRAALLICAAAAAAIPVIVYFATAEVMRRQGDLSTRLITSVSRAAELNATLIGLSEDTEELSSYDEVSDVVGGSAVTLWDLEALQIEFADEFSKHPNHLEAKDIISSLLKYKKIVENITESRIEQLNSLDTLESRRAEVRKVLRDANADLLAVIATTSDQFERRKSSTDLYYEEKLKSDFRKLTLYQSLRQIIYEIEEKVADTSTSTPQRNAVGIAADLRFLMRRLATRTAQAPKSAMRQSLAQKNIVLKQALLGAEGIIAAYLSYAEQAVNVENLAYEEAKIAAELLEYSDLVITTTQADAIRGSNDIADLVRENRLMVLGLSSLLLLVLFGLLFYIVGRKFSRRIASLTDGVLAIAHGDINHEVDIGGNDELTAMSDALHVFRDNRLKLIRINEELEVRNREVRELGTRLQTILDTTTSGIVAFDREGGVVMANLPARRFLGGISENAPFAWPGAIDFLDREDLSRLEASKNPIRRALAGQKLKSEIALIERPGVTGARYMRISSAIVTNEASPIRCVVVLEDVSEAEKNRQQVERAGRLDALGQLTGGIAHDFNNLLATIEYAIELSMRTGVNEKAEKYLRTAVGSVRRGSELTTRLLAFAKRQPGLARSQKISDIMREFRSLVEPSIEEFVTLKFEDYDSSLYVYCDGGQLENAMLNLVLNSRDAILRSGQGDRITISVREVVDTNANFQSRKQQAAESMHRSVAAESSELTGETGSTRFIEFAVTDNGPGMSEEVKRRALDPFFTTKETNSGTGLGLSMVYGFIQNSDGVLAIYSEEGHGTTIRLLLPSGSSQGQREGPVADSPIMKGGGEHILIVEDDMQLREIMADMVGTLGYAVAVASSGSEALAALADGARCDVLLTDIVMPGGIGGFELGAEVRATWPDIPIVYMSGYTGFTEAEMGAAIGRFVQKPCAPSELAEALSAALKTA